MSNTPRLDRDVFGEEERTSQTTEDHAFDPLAMARANFKEAKANFGKARAEWETMDSHEKDAWGGNHCDDDDRDARKNVQRVTDSNPLTSIQPETSLSRVPKETVLMKKYDEWRCFSFDFIDCGHIEQVKSVVKHTHECFLDEANKRKEQFKVPLIDGASGNGKTRLGHEAGQQLSNEDPRFVHVFVDLEFQNYNAARPENMSVYLANVLFHHLADVGMCSKHTYRLADVLSKAASDLGVTCIIMQLDGYAKCPALTLALLTACQKIFNGRGPVVVCPVLTGLPIAKVPLPACVQPRIHLTGMEGTQLTSLKSQFMKQLHRDEASQGEQRRTPPNLEILWSMLGGLPRAYATLLDILRSMDERRITTQILQGNLSLRDAKTLYGLVHEAFVCLYPYRVWRSRLGCYYDITSRTIVHNSTFYEPLKAQAQRLLVAAVVGHPIKKSTKLCPDDPMSSTFEDAFGLGHFSFVEVDGHFHKVSMSALLIHVMNTTIANYFPDHIFNPFDRTPNTLGDLALESIRAIVNCHFTFVRRIERTTDGRIDAEESVTLHVATLRPGAKMTLQTGSTKLTFNQWYDNIETLKDSLHVTPNITAPLSKPDVNLTNHSIFKCATGQEAPDGVFYREPVLWLSHTKSLDTPRGEEASEDPQPDTVEGLAQGMAAYVKNNVEGLPDDTKILCDILATDSASPSLASGQKEAPEGIIYTAIEDLEKVGGPILGLCMRLCTEVVDAGNAE